MFITWSMFFIFITRVSSLDNGLYKTPPMGWMSWATFACETNCDKFPNSCINEKLYREMADRLVQDGFLAAGYNRIHIDDCWMENFRDEKGRLIADHKRFPSGIKNLSKYMHDRQLELGIYECIGKKTCMGYPGSMDSIKVDANTFASWNVDYVKMDGCYANTSFMPTGYKKMERALNATGRRMGHGCGWPLFFYAAGLKDKIDYKAVRAACNTWRIYDDVEGSWKSIAGIIKYIEDNQGVLTYAQAPGGWNDPDMLVVGLPNVTVDQAIVQMTLWSIWSSPLIMSNDLRSLKPEFRKILLNRDVIAIDQDPLGIMGIVVRKTESIRVYVKPVTPVHNGSTSAAIAVVNMNDLEFRKAKFSLKSLGLTNQGGYNLRNLWTGEKLGHVDASYEYQVELAPTSATMLKLTII
ncbi:hypothetical protein KIN20_037139 [Parelaphostrongylus tenuis]|uniref:Alpha-galactosidase n=1 Tax=Parelaphostrongylus tenuis TaxID=148309 RepID=A0AAD5WLS5_PARTN|nr:hypothetical protein KIN20_037139 [Parelaphostrongylus tenuis]